jgi:hypothetical protein
MKGACWCKYIQQTCKQTHHSPMCCLAVDKDARFRSESAVTSLAAPSSHADPPNSASNSVPQKSCCISKREDCEKNLIKKSISVDT